MCAFNLYDRLDPNPMPWEGGGVWAEITPGPPTYLGQGGVIGGGDDGAVDFTNIEDGTYQFTYTVGSGDCIFVGTVTVTVHNGPGPDVGPIELCSDGASSVPITLWDLLEPDTATNGNWIGDVGGAWFSLNGDVTLSTYNPANEPGPFPVTREITYRIPSSPNCVNCRATITITTWFSCSTLGCVCDVTKVRGPEYPLLDVLQECYPGVGEGGVWTWLSGPSNPCTKDFQVTGGGPGFGMTWTGLPLSLAGFGPNPIFESLPGACGLGVYSFRYQYDGLTDINPCPSDITLNITLIDP
jgi:hypothetical protein